MGHSLRQPVVPCQANLDSHVDDQQGNLLSLMRESIEESGWKHAAVAAVLGVEPPYLSRMLAGEKPWSLRAFAQLPDDIEAIFARKYAEAFGLIVVQPVSGEQAVRNLVSGLFGVLAPIKFQAAKAGLKK